MEKVNHPPRGELRRQAVSAQIELAGMKTPQGLAAFLFSKKDDAEFQDAMRAAYRELDSAEAPEEEPVTSPDPVVTT